MARGDPAMPFEQLLPYYRGARFALLAIRARHPGDSAVADDVERYAAMLQRFEAQSSRRTVYDGASRTEAWTLVLAREPLPGRLSADAPRLPNLRPAHTASARFAHHATSTECRALAGVSQIWPGWDPQTARSWPRSSRAGAAGC